MKESAKIEINVSTSEFIKIIYSVTPPTVLALLLLYVVIPYLSLVPISNTYSLGERAEVFYAYTILLQTIILMMTPIVLAAAVYLFSKNRFKTSESKIFIIFLTNLFLLVPGTYLRNNVQDRIYASSLKNLDPLIRAIEKYTSQKGEPPETIDVLLQGYLRKSPSTGLNAYSEIIYLTHKQSGFMNRLPGEKWVVVNGK